MPTAIRCRELVKDYQTTSALARMVAPRRQPRVVHAVYAPTRHVPLKLRALIDYLVEVEGEGAAASTT